MEKEIRETRSQESDQRKKKYEEYITDRSYKSRMAAAVARRPPYHLAYIRMAAAGILQGQGKHQEGTP